MSLALVSESDPADLDARLRRVEAALEDLDAAAVAEPPDGPSAAEEAADSDVYASVADFVAGHLATYAPPKLGVSGARWCPRWPEHPAAVEQLTGLWRSWEHLRRDEHTGIGTWTREHLLVQLPALLADAGPFALCGAHEHGLPDSFPTSAPTGRTPAAGPAGSAAE